MLRARIKISLLILCLLLLAAAEVPTVSGIRRLPGTNGMLQVMGNGFSCDPKFNHVYLQRHPEQSTITRAIETELDLIPLLPTGEILEDRIHASVCVDTRGCVADTYILTYLARLSVYSGGPGSPVTLYGSHFGLTAPENNIYFGSVPATTVSVPPGGEGTELETIVPDGVSPGIINVFVEVGVQLSNHVTFEVLGSRMYPTNGPPSGIVSADFNNDGFFDLVTPLLQGQGNFSVLLGNGDGTFMDAVPNYVSTSSSGIATGDLDKDGNMDLAVSNVDSAAVLIYLGNGDGSFQPPSMFHVGNDPAQIFLEDLNGDDTLDLVVRLAPNAFSVLLGLGAGSFVPYSQFDLPYDILDFELGHLNNDDNVDLVVIYNYAANIVPGNGDGTFGIPYPLSDDPDSQPYWPSAVSIGDYNDDNIMDIAIADSTGYKPKYYMSDNILLFFGNGNGTFEWTWFTSKYLLDIKDISSDDLNNDGHTDLILTSKIIGPYEQLRTSTGNFVTVYLGNGNGSFQVPSAYNTGNLPVGNVIKDFNQDGLVDLAIANQLSDSISVYINQGDGTFPKLPIYHTQSNAYSVAAGDFNRDGQVDLAVVNSSNFQFFSGTVSVFLNSGAGTFLQAVDYDVGIHATSLAIGDINGDGNQDLVTANDLSNRVFILLGTNNGTFLDATFIEVGDKPSSVSIGDINGDGDSDLVISRIHSNTIAILFGNGDGTFSGSTSLIAGDGPRAVALSDLNLDNRLDIIVANENEDTIYVLINNGSGLFQEALSYNVGEHPCSIALADLNGDTSLDLAVANNESNSISILLGRGDGTFGNVIDYTVGEMPLDVALVDLNVDGAVDVVAVNFLDSSLSLLTGKGNGTFNEMTLFNTVAYPTSLTIQALDGNGILDMAVTSLTSNSVAIYLIK